MEIKKALIVSSEKNNFFQGHIESFWKLRRKQVGFLGNAMYFATDPAITQDYDTRFGKTAEDWVLFEVIREI